VRDALRAWLATPAASPESSTSRPCARWSPTSPSPGTCGRCWPIAEQLPHRTRWLLLNHRLSRRVIDAHRAWIAEADELLGDAPPGSAER
jgi:hypothetical protein